MNILITGANGFLGSHLVGHFSNLNDYKVFALVRKCSNLHRLTELKDNKYHLAYIEDVVDDLINLYNLDIIIHTATCYGRNQEKLLELAEINELLPLRLLNNLPKDKKIIFINTHTSLPLLISPYSVAKNNFVNWGKYLASINSLQFINLRLEHFYGLGDDKTKFLEYIISSMLTNVEELKLTSGEQQRDFIHISDVCNAYEVIIKNLHQFGNDFIELDIGTGNTISIHDLILLVKKITNNITTNLNFGAIPYRSNELMESKADTSLLMKLGWEAQLSINDGLIKYIREFKE